MIQIGLIGPLTEDPSQCIIYSLQGVLSFARARNKLLLSDLV